MQGPNTLELVLGRDRVLVLVSIVGVTALAWTYLVLATGAEDMSEMPGMAHDAMLTAHPTTWSATHFSIMLAMWTVMMIGMMLPSAAPVILFFAAFARRSREQGHRVAPTGAFISGYLAVWSGFALTATGLQWGLERAALLASDMASISPLLGGGLLIAAGLYQWSPLKEFCLQFCRSPVAFVTQHWQAGRGGAFRMGLKHGSFCVGCCWALMALLFVGGVMNLLWVATITLAVMAEKLAPMGGLLARLTGIALILGGTWMVATRAG